MKGMSRLIPFMVYQISLAIHKLVSRVKTDIQKWFSHTSTKLPPIPTAKETLPIKKYLTRKQRIFSNLFLVSLSIFTKNKLKTLLNNSGSDRFLF